MILPRSNVSNSCFPYVLGRMIWVFLGTPPFRACAKLQQFTVTIPTRTEDIEGTREESDPKSILQFLGPLLIYLPVSLGVIRFAFAIRPSILFSQKTEWFWAVVDSTLTSQRFPRLKSVEIMWGKRKNTDDPGDPSQRATLEKFIPKTYTRGILRCSSVQKTSHTGGTFGTYDRNSFQTSPRYARPPLTTFEPLTHIRPPVAIHSTSPRPETSP